MPLDNPERPAGVIINSRLNRLTITSAEIIKGKFNEAHVRVWLPAESRYLDGLTISRGQDSRSINIEFLDPLETASQLALEVRIFNQAITDCTGLYSLSTLTDVMERNSPITPSSHINDISFDRLADEYFVLDLVLQAPVAVDE